MYKRIQKLLRNFQLFEEQIQKQNESSNVQDVIENKENHIIRPKMEKKASITEQQNTKEETLPDTSPTSEENKNNNNTSSRPLSSNIFAAMDRLNNQEQDETVNKPLARKPTVRKTFIRVSKFKHLKGDVMLKGRFENLKNLSRTVPAECNFIKGESDTAVLGYKN